MRKITTIRLDDADRAAIAVIRQRYGVVSDSDAMRLAVRLVAESKRVDIRQDAGQVGEVGEVGEADHNGRNEPA